MAIKIGPFPILPATRERILERSYEHQIEIGRDLLRAKKAVPSGYFADWLRANFPWSTSTANHYMKSALLMDSSTEFAKLKPSAITVLAAHTTPDIVRVQVLTELTAGATPTLQEISVRIAEATRRDAQMRVLRASARFDRR